MRKALYGCIAVLALAGIISYGFLSAPKVIRLDRELQVTAYKLNDSSFAEAVTVKLKGAFAEKSESYTGMLTVNGLQYDYCGLSAETGVMICAPEGSGSEISSIGQVYADAGFQTWSLALQKGDSAPGYKENSFFYAIDKDENPPDDTMIISYAAENREAAVRQYESLRAAWAEKQTD